jgi:flagellar FliL protein
MAAEAEIGEAKGSTGGAGAPGKVKLPFVTLLVVVMLGVFLAMGVAAGALDFLVKSGRLSWGAAGPAAVPSAAAGEAGHPMVLEPILVNLADAGGHAYLRLGLTLDVEGDAARPESGHDGKDARDGKTGRDGKDGKTPSEQDLAVRDTVLAVLGQQTSAWLLGPDGKEHLKIELKEALAKQNAELKVKNVYFTDFLVQI